MIWTRRIKAGDLHLHIGDIQRMAIVLFKTPNVFADEKRFERWRLCIRLVAETWLEMGVQSYGNGQGVILLPWTRQD